MGDAKTAASMARNLLYFGAPTYPPSSSEQDDKAACMFIGVAYYASSGNALLNPPFNFCNFISNKVSRTEAIAGLDAFLESLQ
jgi:hypothetical protein